MSEVKMAASTSVEFALIRQMADDCLTLNPTLAFKGIKSSVSVIRVALESIEDIIEKSEQEACRR